VELRPLAVSLNSFNGFLTLANGGRLFFKTRGPGSVIGEYYNSKLLADAATGDHAAVRLNEYQAASDL